MINNLPDLCKEDECNNPVQSRGWCGMHYMRWYKHGDPMTVLQPHRQPLICSIDGCEKKHSGHGYCSSHNRAYNLYGDPLERRKPETKYTCSIPDCTDVAISLTYCHKHYVRYKKHGDPYNKGPQFIPYQCSIEGCENTHYCKTYCSVHYNRLIKYGDVHYKPLRQRRKAIGTRKVLRDGYIRVYQPKWSNRKDGWILEHRHVMSEHLNRQLLSYENVHHKNADRSDNRIENLELWTISQPPGGRVEDKIAWAKEILGFYEPESLRANGDAPLEDLTEY